MASLFSTKQKMPTTKPVRMPNPADAEEEAKRKLRLEAAQRGGRRSTILSDLSNRVGAGGTNLGAGA